MIPSKPYLIRAIYEWLTDNHLTPYIMIDALFPGVAVPTRAVENGQIILNIASQAIAHLSITNEHIEFDTRFSGVSHHIFAPIMAVKAIYSSENGRGMVFNEEEADDDETDTEGGSDSDPHLNPPTGKRPNLKIVK